MEYWIVYDLATGEERWRGSGAVGAAAQQELLAGLGMVLVPAAVIRGAVVDLALMRSAVAARIDAEAEQVRGGFLTPGTGQAMTYQRKEAEARAWVTDNTASVPFLAAEAPARGMTIAEVAAEVIAFADAWTLAGAAIEGLRLGAKTAVADAATIGAIVAAGQVDWSAVTA